MKNTCIAILSIIFLTTSCYQDEQQENCINDVKNQLSINSMIQLYNNPEPEDGLERLLQYSVLIC